MKQIGLGVFLIFLFCSVACASLTLHIQFPWGNDSSKDGYMLHVLGGAGGGYNPGFGAGSSTIMTDEGNGWFSYVWEKEISQFQDWEKFNISAYPNTDDQNYNNNNGVKWVNGSGTQYEFTMAQIFGTETEVWLYVDQTDHYTFTKSFAAPGSKIVWFKSPWGNHALPQMIFGLDTITMHFDYESSKCGWFYGSVSPVQVSANPSLSAYFRRFASPWLSVPENNEVVDLSVGLSSADTVFVDGTVAPISVGNRIGTPGVCFDSSRTLHIYNPWRSNSTYRDTALCISVGNNIINNATAMEADEYKYWYKYIFSAATASSSAWGSGGASVQLYPMPNMWPQVVFFQEAQKPIISQFFPAGVYEAWLYPTKSGRYDLKFSPPDPKVIRLMSPWENMSPSMIVEGDTIKMGPFSKDTCGWYEGIQYKHTENWEVFFRQSFGFETYYAEGSYPEGEGPGTLISLDTMINLLGYDTLWIMPSPTLSSAPKQYDYYPGKLGICPTMKISALVLDWAGEGFDDSIDVDFGGIYQGNQYTTVTYLDSTGVEKTNAVCAGHVRGMVQDTLVNGLPARVDSSVYPWGECSAAHEIEKWFVPVEVAYDASGKAYTNAVCKDIDLTLDEEGFWLADISESHERGGFFPLDDWVYLDSAETVKNPKYDWKPELATSVDGKTIQHNYSFSMKISAQFQYVKGQYFEFRGDDDVWVYIDNRLVVDIGGCHSPVEGAVDLDTMNLIEGKTYPFHIFFSERNATGSNFKMRTSINLQTEKTYMPIQIPRTDGNIQYEIWQRIVEENLTCDISSIGKVETKPAQSVFVLLGGSMPAEGKALEIPGVYYGGITISENMAGFVIDTAAIIRTRSLPPGNYILQYALASDISQYDYTTFVVPEYPLPTIAFADTLTGDTLPEAMQIIEDTLYISIPVRMSVKVLYFGETCADCQVVLDLKTSDSLIFLDMNDQEITTVETDAQGFAHFKVMGTAAANDVSFTVSGNSVDNVLTWKHLNFKEPLVPYAKKGGFFDRNGDGIPDSIYVSFNRKFEEDIPDRISWLIGDSTWHDILGTSNVVNHIEEDSLLTIVSQAGSNLLNFTFTGMEQDPYKGGFKYHYIYTDPETGEVLDLQDMRASLNDNVGAIVMSAVVTPQSDNVSMLTILLSEGSDAANLDVASLFELKVWRMGNEVSSSVMARNPKVSRNGLRYDIYYYSDETGVLPSVGDSIRLVPGLLKDLSGNTPHINNPWVRITGGQRLGVELADVVTIGTEKAMETALQNNVTAMPVSVDMTIKDVQNTIGLPGHLLTYNLQDLGVTARDSLPLDSIRITWSVYYFSNIGQFISEAKGVVSCADQAVFGGDCTKNAARIFLAWNGRSHKGRLVGTGAYISKLDWRVKAGGETVGKKYGTYTIGVIRGK